LKSSNQDFIQPNTGEKIMGFNPTMFDHQRAFAIALSTDNRVGQMMRAGQEIMFQYGTETELCFKHALTRQSYFLNYQGQEV
tara:strand:+ start:627 stop:872 length:246 start_codon:yes stop_codon:yes gene_type:complete